MEGYTREVLIYDTYDFGFDINSTSHIEIIWSQLKATIKNIYYIISHRNFLGYLREAEQKVKNKNKHLIEKINDFFNCWAFIYQMDHEDF